MTAPAPAVVHPGYQIHRALIPHRLVETARRRLLLELRRSGVTAEQVADWASNSWWPARRWEPELDAVRDSLALSIDLPAEHYWAETQILVRLPDEDDTELGQPHLDTLPPWADGLRYRAIYGVELTDTPEWAGSTVLYPQGPGGIEISHALNAGDVLQLDPGLWHSGSPNRGTEMRIALFFRLLEPVSS